MYGVSLTSFEFGLRLTEISLLGGLLTVSGANGGEMILEGWCDLKLDVAEFKKDMSMSNFVKLFQTCKFDLRARVSVRISVLYDIASCLCDLTLSSGYICAKIELQLFGIILFAGVKINDG